MDGEVEPHQLGELGVTVTQHVGEVVRPVQVGVDGSDAAALTVQVAIDLSGDAWQLGDQVHGVFIHKLREHTHVHPVYTDLVVCAAKCVCLFTHLPVLGLVDALRVSPCKAALAVQSCDGSTELRHGVEVCGEVIQHGDDVRGKCSSLGPFFGHPVHLRKQEHAV